ncbi:hypothetical protein PUNSTDRAFT_41286 [Punctularia strigosozonata HHB-11173 SS5]|uniref:uncharacterized protein n=1 Tax=Punctularia strigosozonata (strain HHB-11173) TaxID=741275 RepID=UPI0004418573|nr:uncharacterized protein PUNSTDRAFT_41286 [Punctularia strigosozonata HHB-11173 SS5]EIN13862.1 hypothetical protein PUNSTDRAFT_41286 [Punctularia strigosozonata HHB-11173 SS5]
MVSLLTFSLPLLNVLALYVGVARSNLRGDLLGHATAHDTAFHDGLLKQLASARASASPTPSSVPSESTGVEENATVLSGINGDVLAADDSASLQIYVNDTIPTDPVPPNACANALVTTIPCNSTIPLMAISGSGNVTISPTLAVDYVRGPYMTQCLQDPQTSAFCGPIIQSYNATGGLLSIPKDQLCTYSTYSVAIATLLSSAIDLCGPQFDSYNISSAPGGQVIFDPGVTGFGANSSAAPAADCSIVGRNVTTSTATTCAEVAERYNVSEYSVLASNPSLADCDIAANTILCVPQACNTYTIAANDTCDSVAAVAASQAGISVTTTQLQSFNPDLGTYCQLMALRVGKLICLSPNGGFPKLGATTGAQPSATPTALAPLPTPTVSGTTTACGRWYQVQSGDICQTVALANSVSLADFQTLNPQIDENCTNLWLDYYYCVAPYPPFASITVSPVVTTNYSSATVISYTIPSDNYTPTTYLVALTTAGISAPTNVADGTRTVACGNYYVIQDGDTIDSVSTLVGVNASDLESWNPEIASGSLPQIGSAICIVFPLGNYTLFPAIAPVNAYPNATKACAEFYTVQAGDGCSSIADEFGITSLQFAELNPGLMTDCTNLILGEAYCVFPTFPISNIDDGSGVPPNVAPGTITDGCLQYYTVVTGDSCGPIEVEFNLTNTEFLTYNPEINADCSNLQLDLAYCVRSNLTTGEDPGAGDGDGPPDNLASGSLGNCTSYHTIISGDNCPSIETTYSIAATDFFRW